jgi:hypothetical protein
MINEVFSMRKSIPMLSAALLLSVGLVPAADAFTLSVVPQSSTVNVGGTVSVAVVASDLVGAAQTLGDYDLNLSFDSSVLSFSSIVFGTGLSVTGVPSLVQDYLTGTGVVNPFESSFESVADLETLQPDAFTLFTITFNALGAGTSALSLGVNALGNASGAALSYDALNSGSISVAGAPAVPVPAGVWLLLSGVAGVGSFLRRRRGGAAPSRAAIERS